MSTGAKRRVNREGVFDDEVAQGIVATAAAETRRRTPKDDGPAVRLTFNLPADLHRRVKLAAVSDGRAIKDIAAELFEQWLQERPTA